MTINPCIWLIQLLKSTNQPINDDQMSEAVKPTVTTSVEMGIGDLNDQPASRKIQPANFRGQQRAPRPKKRTNFRSQSSRRIRRWRKKGILNLTPTQWQYSNQGGSRRGGGGGTCPPPIFWMVRLVTVTS